MYLGMLLALAGWSFWLGSLTPWLVLPVFTTLLTVLQIVPEERALAANFGTAYRHYQRRTDRWFGHFPDAL
jgi:protein-S-isoprenylcysteine O-methyltransferase Ste14